MNEGHLDGPLFPPQASESERRLIERAAAWPEHPDWRGLTAPLLAAVAATQGIDFATALFYARLRAEAPTGRFLRRMETDEQPPVRHNGARIVIMPGAFHAEHCHSGADGERVFQLGGQLGWPVERVPVPSLAPMQENASTLLAFLRARQGERIVLVSLSKGAADVVAALERRDAAGVFRNVAWVDISGMAAGTALVQWLRARPLRTLGVHLLLWLRRQQFAVLDELRRDPGSPLGKPLSIPPDLCAIHVFGVPLVGHLSDDWARRAHARLRALGPSDGGGILLADVSRLPGRVFPIWGADHYLRPPWVGPLLSRVLREAAAALP